MVVPPPTKNQAPRRARADAPDAAPEPLDPGAGTAPAAADIGARSRRPAVLAVLGLAVVIAAGALNVIPGSGGFDALALTHATLTQRTWRPVWPSAWRGGAGFVRWRQE